MCFCVLYICIKAWLICDWSSTNFLRMPNRDLLELSLIKERRKQMKNTLSFLFFLKTNNALLFFMQIKLIRQMVMPPYQSHCLHFFFCSTEIKNIINIINDTSASIQPQVLLQLKTFIRPFQ